MVPLLATSDGQERKVKEACEVVIQSFSNEDPLELDMAMATMMRDCVGAATAVHAILDLSIDPSHDAAIEKLRSRRGKTDRSIVTMVANALAASPKLADNLDLLGRGRMLVLEYGAKAVQGMEFLLDQPQVQESYIVGVRNLCADLGKIKASNGCELFEAYGTRVLGGVSVLVKKAIDDVQAQQLVLTQELLVALDQCVSDAVIAFPMDRELIDHQAQLATIITRESGHVRLESLKRHLQKGLFFDLGAAGSLQRMQDVGAALQDCAGMDIPPEIAEVADKEVLSLGMSLAESIGQSTKKDGVAGALNLWDMFVDKVGSRSAPGALLTLAKRVVAVLDTSNSIASLAETTTMEMKQPEVQKLSVELSLGATASEAAASASGSELKTCLQAKWVAINTTAHDIVERFAKEFFEDRKSALAKLLEKARDYAKGYHMGARWYDGVTGSADKDWDVILEKAKATVFTLDTKAFCDILQDIGVAMESVQKAADLLTSGLAGANDPLPEAKEQVNNMSILVRQALLAWHLSKEVDREALRRKVQAEIKALRALGLKERDCLPPAVYRKAWDALTCAA